MFFEIWKNFSFKVSDCLKFESPGLCNGIMLGKKFCDFFQFWLLFFAVCKQLWAILVKRLVITKLRQKKITFLNQTPWNKFKIFNKIFLPNHFFSTVSDFFKVAIAIRLESRVGYQQLFTKFGRFWFFLAIFGKVWVNFSKKHVLADLGLRHCIAER